MAQPSFPVRPPTAALAGCIFLPRFLDKVRAHASGAMTPDFAFAFCHAKGMDGHFFAHFGLQKDAVLAAVTGRTDDEAAAWFLAQPGVTPATIAAWNDYAPKIGRVGESGHRELQFVLRRMFGAQPVPAEITSSFTAIAWDERPDTPAVSPVRAVDA